MAPAARGALLAATVVLAGCPDPGRTTDPVDAAEAGSRVVSVCYAPLFTDLESEIRPVAQDACAEAGVADATLVYWERSFFLNDCPLFKKMRITFICEPAATD